MITIGVGRIGYELRQYFRQPEAVFFTFLFPIVMLALFSVAFSASPDIHVGPNGPGVTFSTDYLPGLVATGAFLSGTQALGVDIATERGDGTLKRLGGTPLPVLSYFVGKIGMVLVTAVVQTVLLLAVATVVFHVTLPTSGSAIASGIGLLVLGIATSCVLGIAVSSLPRDGKRATAVIVPIVLVLQFISGVYLPFTQLPAWLQNLASIFPLRWLASGMRSVLLPDAFHVAEPGDAWHVGEGSLILFAWFVAGLALCALTFRWNKKDT
ncbi:ABC transporter permease [Curtobacterium ammoniigenes]|uniref:ABC transporter permease n=1 Tax=Curtobacterium ammoniigenes TaxID=395387 RepID=UPI00082D1043|nr:ABC transporter permease [Curtobacterium ammoniigenes]